MDASPCSGEGADYLVSALATALAQGQHTPELGRAARNWGAGFSAPVEALASVTALRDVILEAEQSPASHGLRHLPRASETTGHLLDQVMLEAVDAASSNLRTQVRTDPLTGCANRYALNEDLARSAGSAARSGLDLAVAAVDLDGLKRINDTQGHAAGDEALKELVAHLRDGLREADTIYRIGGDEFVVVAPFTDAAGASAMLERVSRRGGPRFSWGVTSMSAIGASALEHPEMLLGKADSDLYMRRRNARMRGTSTHGEPDARRDKVERRSIAAAVAGIASLATARHHGERHGAGSTHSGHSGPKSAGSAPNTGHHGGQEQGRRHLPGRTERSRAILGAVAASVLLLFGAVFGVSALAGHRTNSTNSALGSRRPGATTTVPATVPTTTVPSTPTTLTPTTLAPSPAGGSTTESTAPPEHSSSTAPSGIHTTGSTASGPAAVAGGSPAPTTPTTEAVAPAPSSSTVEPQSTGNPVDLTSLSLATPKANSSPSPSPSPRSTSTTLPAPSGPGNTGNGNQGAQPPPAGAPTGAAPGPTPPSPSATSPSTAPSPGKSGQVRARGNSGHAFGQSHPWGANPHHGGFGSGPAAATAVQPGGPSNNSRLSGWGPGHGNGGGSWR